MGRNKSPHRNLESVRRGCEFGDGINRMLGIGHTCNFVWLMQSVHTAILFRLLRPVNHLTQKFKPSAKAHFHRDELGGDWGIGLLPGTEPLSSGVANGDCLDFAFRRTLLRPLRHVVT